VGHQKSRKGIRVWGGKDSEKELNPGTLNRVVDGGGWGALAVVGSQRGVQNSGEATALGTIWRAKSYGG